jgi:enoyl-CoA hydratase/carnithine racemase
VLIGSDLPTYRTLHVDVDRGVATITLNRPHRRNAVGDGMREELADAYLWCDGVDAIRVVVLTGAPPAFCAGADSPQASGRSPSRGRRFPPRASTCPRGR